MKKRSLNSISHLYRSFMKLASLARSLSSLNIYCLACFREDKALIARFLPAQVSTAMIRQEVESSLTKGEKIPTAVEIPLSRMSKRVLEYAQEESENLKHSVVATEHLLLGLLRQQSNAFGRNESIAERVLRENGLNLAEVRQRIESKWENN
jgi:ATP-dependent Clp protease ATP-binding subunit ClpA